MPGTAEPFWATQLFIYSWGEVEHWDADTVLKYVIDTVVNRFLALEQRDEYLVVVYHDGRPLRRFRKEV